MDFFISYAGADQGWAEWIAGTLEEAGFTTILQAWDFRPGDDFVHRMHEAIASAARTVVVLSPDYLRSAFGGAEWRAVFARDPAGERGLLLPVRVRECTPDGLLASRAYIDLVGVGPAEAADRLRAGVARGRVRPGEVRFPGADGWRLADDPEAIRHWLPRSRGVSRSTERGHRFRGRTAALREIVAWLDRPTPDRRVLAVTGSPGVGKSAVLGRIVATADPGVTLPADDDAAVRATTGSVACAVHAKGRTAVEVAREIARAAGVPPLERPEDLAPALHERLAGDARRFTVVIDAVDEAATAADARTVLTEIAQPLAQDCGTVGVRVVVGSRRHDHEGRLLDLLGAAARIIDLDLPAYFELADLRDYTLATLRGDDRPGNPYADEGPARPVAHRIAELAGRNFLVAGLEARRRAMYDETAADPGTLTFTGTVDATLDIYLRRIPAVGGLPARVLLTALARAEAPGWTTSLWRLALDAGVSERQLEEFARSSAADFLIDSGDGSFRLFHQALTDALLRDRGIEDEKRITRAFLDHGRSAGWAGYLARSLPAHAARAGLIDEVLAEDTFLLHADLLRLLPAAEDARTPAGRDRVRLLRLTPQAAGAGAAERAAMFSVTAAVEELPPIAGDVAAPYRARWAHTRPRVDRAVFDGHEHTVDVVCTVNVRGRPHIASGDSQEVIIWDPANGHEHGRFDGPRSLSALCSAPGEHGDLLVTGDRAGELQIWDVERGEQLIAMRTLHKTVRAIVAVPVAGRTVLVSAGRDGAIAFWELPTGRLLGTVDGRAGPITSLCVLTVGGVPLVASGGADGFIRLWDPVTMRGRGRLGGNAPRGVTAIRAYETAGEVMLASGDADGGVALWDPRSGEERARIRLADFPIDDIGAVERDGKPALAIVAQQRIWCWEPPGAPDSSTLSETDLFFLGLVRMPDRTLVLGYEHALRVWDLADIWGAAPPGQVDPIDPIAELDLDGDRLLATVGLSGEMSLWVAGTGERRLRMPRGHGDARTVAPVAVAGRLLLASGSEEGVLRLWDPHSGLVVSRATPVGAIRAVCPMPLADGDVLAVGCADGTVRVWEPATGQWREPMAGGLAEISALRAAVTDAGVLLAGGSRRGVVKVWDPVTGQELHTLEGHRGEVWCLGSIRVDGRTLLASAGEAETAVVWDMTTGEFVSRARRYTGTVGGIAEVRWGGRTLLATGGYERRTVGLWDPLTGEAVLTIPVHHGALAVARLRTGLAVGLEAGLLVLDLADQAS